MPDDARLVELTLLSRLEQGLDVPALPAGDCPERRVVIHLVEEEYVQVLTGLGTLEARYFQPRGFAHQPWTEIDSYIAGYQSGPLRFAVTHRGAVRRAELEQQLKSARIKEPMGIVWDGRHFRQDTRIALLDASPANPLAVAYLDLNDVRVFNAVSHETGDAAIRGYLSTIAEMVFDRGDAYRLSGGADELVLLLPRLSLDPALEFIRKLLGGLGREKVTNLALRAAAGLVVATDPGESVDALKGRADTEQGRAKSASKAHDRRPSVLAWSPDHLEVL